MLSGRLGSLFAAPLIPLILTRSELNLENIFRHYLTGFRDAEELAVRHRVNTLSKSQQSESLALSHL
jgi:hypothetical protein